MARDCEMELTHSGAEMYEWLSTANKTFNAVDADEDGKLSLAEFTE